MSGKNSIQVAIKVRPLLKKEKERDQQPMWRVVDNSIQLADSQTDPYYFDHIFDQEATNQIIFDKMAKHIVHSAIEGFNGTIFAYGQTSSGKTYTMMGDDDNPGVMVLAVKAIFQEITMATDRQFLLRVGYIEIYNEKIYDLLNKKNQDLKIHETATGIISVNCEECIIKCEEDLMNCLSMGNKERTVGETNMNERSSRSHAIFRIIIESRKVERSEDDSVIQSVLNLVDLAGSERADQTGARGTRLKEGGHINKSLLFLSNVIKHLSENEDNKYISYRDSKLTRILQASLGGNALTAIICTIKPTALEETQSTLSFALRAKTIKNKPQVNETVSDATMMKRLEREVKDLRTRLEEEQRKNESQIKVKQLEQRIRDECLKIISCSSLHSVRNREKRRRTWCPSSNLNASSSHLPSALPVPTLMNPTGNSAIPPPSRLQAPKSSSYYTPLITMRPAQRPSGPSIEDIPAIDEEFLPAEMMNFEMLSPMHTPKMLLHPRISITPKVLGNPKKVLETLEQDLVELRSFTNLENKIDVHHSPESALKEKISTLESRNNVLENERLIYIQVKDELVLSQNKLDDLENRCGELQILVSKLTKSNEVANKKISKYEEELVELKKANEKLQMENRDAVNLEFEFERHKNKSKLRENELLEVLKDKENDIIKLEKSLKSIDNEKLQNSKEELLQLSLTEQDFDEQGKVCVKCEDLQRLLEDNKKVTQEFTKLTLEYEKLKLNYQEIANENEKSKEKVNELEELQKAERAEREILKKDLQSLRETLQTIQSEYERESLENSSKAEECMALNHQVELARKEMVALEQKYTKLELTWQEQQQTLKDIESQYVDIESKYKQLQSEYEQLESCKGQSETNCERLQKENLELQTEIVELKTKVQDVQQQLLENAANQQEKISSESESISGAKKENEELKQQLTEIQTQFEDLQKEYDDLSNQLMDNLQESDTLKEQNIKLEEQLKTFEEKNTEVSNAQAEIDELKSQLEQMVAINRKSLNTASPCHNLSMRSSGVCMETEEFEDDLFEKFCELSEYLTQIELEYQNGKRKLFKIPNSTQTSNYKLYLCDIMGVSKVHKDFVEETESIHLQGSFKRHTFHIVELNKENGIEAEAEVDEVKCNEILINGCGNCSETIAKLEEQISTLRILNEQERESNKSLVENTERTLSEMREQITQLSAELLEKSMFVENCACKSYQKQIEDLEKEKADITLVFEEFQEKVNNGTFNGSSLFNCTGPGETPTPPADDLKKNLELLQTNEKHLLDTLDSQTKMLEELTQRNLDLETDLKDAQEKVIQLENEYKENCRHLQLEMLSKLDMSANEHRDNVKKYNKEWEDHRETYENSINEFENQIKTLQQENTNVKESSRHLQEELDKLKEELKRNTEAKLREEQIILEERMSQGDNLQEDKKVLEDKLQAFEEEREQNDQKLKNLEEELKDMKIEKKERNELLSQLQQKIDAIVEQNEEKLKTLDNLQQSHIKLEEQLKDMEIEKNELLSQLQQERDAIVEQTEEKLKALDNLQQSHIKLEQQLKDVENEKKEKNELLSQLQEEKNALTEQNKELDHLQQNHIKLEQQLKDVENEKNELLSQLQQEREALVEQNEEKLKELDYLQHSHIQLEQQLKYIVDEKKEKNELFSQLQQERDALAKQNDEQLKELDNLQQSHMHLEQQLKCIEIEKKDTNELLSQLQTERDALAKLNDEQLQELDDLRQRHRQLEQQLNDVEIVMKEKTELEHQLQEINEQRTTLDDNISKKQALEQQIQELLNKINIHQQQNEELQNQIAAQQTALEQYESQVAVLKDSETKYKTECEDLRESLNSLSNSNSILVLEKCNMEMKLEACNVELQHLTSEGVSLDKQLKLLTEEKMSLNDRCSRLEEEKTTLTEEKIKCLTAKEKAEKMLQQLTDEKSENAQKLRVTQEIVETKGQEFDLLQQEAEKAKHNVELLKSSLTNANRDKQQLEKELEDYKQFLEDRTKLEATITDLKTSHTAAIDRLQKEIERLQQTVNEYECTNSVYKEKEETLLHKVETLSQKLHELQSKANAYDSLLLEHEEVEKSLTAAIKQKEELAMEMVDLKSSISTTTQSYKETIQTQNEQIQQLDSKLAQTKQSEEISQAKLLKIQQNLQAENSNLQRESQDLKNSIVELQLKYDSLQATNAQLQTLNLQLEQQLAQAREQLKASTSVQEELSAMKMQYVDLQQKMEVTVNEAGQCSRVMRDDLENSRQLLKKQMESYNALAKEINVKELAFNEEKEQLSKTIEELKGTNSNLEEKIRQITINNFKQDLDATSSSSCSPRARRSIESMNISIEDKLMTNLQKSSQQTNERKNRRLSTFDERRRESVWGSSHDRQTMTDPVDASCNCEELDQKLQKSKQDLFISESRVTALNIELKNHPLKEENAALKKRLHEEQDKYRIEIKRYKQKLYDQIQKAEKVVAYAAAAENKTPEVPISSATMVSVDTQTDGDVSDKLTKLQGKYCDLVNICRHRKNMIHELEERLAQKENADGNSQDCGMLQMFKSKCESYRKELKTLQQKYEQAKVVLHTRREEIQRLRGKLPEASVIE